jgi:hypothetical protein
MTYDGRISFEKELFHAHGDTAQFPPFEEPKYLWRKGSGIRPTNNQYAMITHITKYCLHLDLSL